MKKMKCYIIVIVYVYIICIYLLYSGESRKVICGMFEQSSFYYLTSSCIYLYSIFMQVTLRFCDDLIAKKRGNNTRADYLI